MNQKQAEIIGSTQVVQEIARTQAASLLQPSVTVRTLQKYLEVAAIFLPSFAEFQDKQTGNLNRFTKLNTWHLPKLQRIRDYIRTHGMAELQIALSKNPQYFELGNINNGNNYSSSSSTQSTSEKAA